MASHHTEPAKIEQIITEFFAKTLHIILESRSPYVSSRNYSSEQALSSPSPSSSSSSSSFRPRDKWFNLALRDCPAALENIDFWRQSNLEPMIVDVLLSPSQYCSTSKGLAPNLYYYGSDNDEFGRDPKSETVIERWLVHYETKRSSGNSNKRLNCNSSHALYKKSILVLRSLYLTVRLLPAFKLFRDLISSAEIQPYNLGHRVSSFVEPFTRKQEADMQRFVFTPIETSCGRLCISVLYRSSVWDVNSEPSTPISPQFIPEYVGSPMAEPLKRFPSGPVSQSSPSSSPFTRRHSWSYDFYRATSPTVNPSPSPTYSESHVALSKRCSHCLPPAGLPHHLQDETPAVHMKTPSYDEYWPSPIFSSSPSPSPPTYIPGSQVFKVLSRCESAPVSIPTSRLSSVQTLPTNQVMLPSPPVKATRPTVSKRDARAEPYQPSSPVQKLFSFSRDEQGKMSSMKPSSISSPPSKSYSRSSSRLSFQDDYDDSEFSGPFIVDDDDMIDPGSRPGSFDQLRHSCGSHETDEVIAVKKSQDAAVGALVRMLKKAPPLRQDISVTAHILQSSKLEKLYNYMPDYNEISGEQSHDPLSVSSSGLISSKTTADALEELHAYREMKEVLLKQGKVCRE